MMTLFSSCEATPRFRYGGEDAERHDVQLLAPALARLYPAADRADDEALEIREHGEILDVSKMSGDNLSLYTTGKMTELSLRSMLMLFELIAPKLGVSVGGFASPVSLIVTAQIFGAQQVAAQSVSRGSWPLDGGRPPGSS